MLLAHRGCGRCAHAVLDCWPHPSAQSRGRAFALVSLMRIAAACAGASPYGVYTLVFIVLGPAVTAASCTNLQSCCLPQSRYADRAGALATAARWGFGPGRYDRTVHGSQSLAGRNRRPQLRLWRREQRQVAGVCCRMTRRVGALMQCESGFARAALWGPGLRRVLCTRSGSAGRTLGPWSAECRRLLG